MEKESLDTLVNICSIIILKDLLLEPVRFLLIRKMSKLEKHIKRGVGGTIEFSLFISAILSILYIYLFIRFWLLLAVII